MVRKGIAPDRAHHQIGRGVVADRDHQDRRGLERHRRAVRPGLHDAAGKALGVEWHDIVPREPSLAHRTRQRGEDVKLERGAQRVGLCRIAIAVDRLSIERTEPRRRTARKRGDVRVDLVRSVIQLLEILQQQRLDQEGRLRLQAQRPARQRLFEAQRDFGRAGIDRLDRFDAHRRTELRGHLLADLRELFGRDLREERGCKHLVGRLLPIDDRDHVVRARFETGLQRGLLARLGACLGVGRAGSRGEAGGGQRGPDHHCAKCLDLHAGFPLAVA